MNNVKVRYFDDARITISGKNPYPIRLHLFGTFGTLNLEMDNVLSGDSAADKAIIAAMSQGFKQTFDKHTSVSLIGCVEIAADSIYKIELCNKDDVLIATINNGVPA